LRDSSSSLANANGQIQIHLATMQSLEAQLNEQSTQLEFVRSESLGRQAAGAEEAELRAKLQESLEEVEQLKEIITEKETEEANVSTCAAKFESFLLIFWRYVQSLAEIADLKENSSILKARLQQSTARISQLEEDKQQLVQQIEQQAQQRDQPQIIKPNSDDDEVARLKMSLDGAHEENVSLQQLLQEREDQQVQLEAEVAELKEKLLITKAQLSHAQQQQQQVSTGSDKQREAEMKAQDENDELSRKLFETEEELDATKALLEEKETEEIRVSMH
jgi:chromosome segregation ATPase